MFNDKTIVEFFVQYNKSFTLMFISIYVKWLSFLILEQNFLHVVVFSKLLFDIIFDILYKISMFIILYNFKLTNQYWGKRVNLPPEWPQGPAC